MKNVVRDNPRVLQKGRTRELELSNDTTVTLGQKTGLMTVCLKVVS